MDEWRRHIEEVEGKLLKELITAIETDKVKEEEIPPMANLVLQKIDAAKNHEQLIEGLKELSAKWPFLGNIEEIEKGEVKDVHEDKIEQDVLNLAKKGQVEQAINLAKTMTEG